jgi:hypothetical protein
MDQATEKSTKKGLSGPSGKIIVEFLLEVDEQEASLVGEKAFDASARAALSKDTAAAAPASSLSQLLPSCSNTAATTSTFSTLQFAHLWEAHVGAGSRFGGEDEEDLDAMYM